MRRLVVSSVIVCCMFFGSAVVSADIRSDQRVKFQLGGMVGKLVNLFGGKGAREGVVSSVAVKGDRKATMSDTTGQIIDLNEEKIYDLDIRRKTRMCGIQAIVLIDADACKDADGPANQIWILDEEHATWQIFELIAALPERGRRDHERDLVAIALENREACVPDKRDEVCVQLRSRNRRILRRVRSRRPDGPNQEQEYTHRARGSSQVHRFL